MIRPAVIFSCAVLIVLSGANRPSFPATPYEHGKTIRALAGKLKCAVPIGTRGIRVRLEEAGPAADAAQIAEADAIQDAESHGFPHNDGERYGFAAAFIGGPSRILIVRGANSYSCGSAACSFQIFSETHDAWVDRTNLFPDLGNEFYVYSRRAKYPRFTNAAVIKDDSVLYELNPTSGRYEACGGEFRVALKDSGGTLSVPVLINNTITLDFTIDSGASDVSIPEDVFSTLVRAGTIASSDIRGVNTYRMANGMTEASATFVIRSLKVGGITVHDVIGSVGSAQGMLLLGQSFLKHFKSWSIDNDTKELLLQ